MLYGFTNEELDFIINYDIQYQTQPYPELKAAEVAPEYQTQQEKKRRYDKMLEPGSKESVEILKSNSKIPQGQSILE